MYLENWALFLLFTGQYNAIPKKEQLIYSPENAKTYKTNKVVLREKVAVAMVAPAERPPQLQHHIVAVLTLGKAQPTLQQQYHQS